MVIVPILCRTELCNTKREWLQLSSLCLKMNFYFVNWKLTLTSVLSPKGFIREKERIAAHCLQTWQPLCLACQDGETFIQGKRELRERGARTTELYYKHRAHPVVFFRALGIAQEASLSPSSSHRPSGWLCLLARLVSLYHFSPTMLLPPFTCTPALLPRPLPSKITKISFVLEYLRTSVLEGYKLGAKTKLRSFSACSFLKDFIVSRFQYLSELLGVLS